MVKYWCEIYKYDRTRFLTQHYRGAAKTAVRRSLEEIFRLLETLAHFQKFFACNDLFNKAEGILRAFDILISTRALYETYRSSSHVGWELFVKRQVKF